MKLIIAEKEELAKAIVKYFISENENLEQKQGYFLGKNYIISWASGHIFKLKSPEEYNENYKKWNLTDLPIYFKNWEKVPLKKSENSKANFQFSILKKLLSDNKISEIYHTGDPDDEGQYLIDEILDYFNNKKPVKRLFINDTTIGGIKKAFNNIQDNNNFLSVGLSAYGRAVADYMIGINLSRYFTCKNKVGTLSVGRVQTPTLAMIVNRDNAVENHIKEKYFELFSNIEIIKSDNINLDKAKSEYIKSFEDEKLSIKEFENTLKKYENLKNNINIILKYNLSKVAKEEFPNGKITRKEFLENISTLLENKNDLKIIVTKEIKKEYPPLPFNLAKLQTVCSNKFNYSPKEVMDITQSLRDNYSAITYNRSDCEYLSMEQYSEAEKTMPIILNNLGITVPEIDLTIKSKAFDDSNITAHTGIIPTKEKIDFNSLTEKEKNVYKLIADYYIIQFLPSRVYEKTIATMKVEDTEFNCSSTKTLNIGFKSYLSNIDEEKKEEEISEISSLINGEYAVKYLNSNIETKYTNPPKYYTEGNIITDMCSISKYVDDKNIKETLKAKDKGKKGENGSIGTPATRSGILESLYKRGFIIKEGKNVKSTSLGKELISILPSDVTKPNLTALWWLKQEDIKKNLLTVDNFLESVLDNIKEILNKEYKVISSSNSIKPTKESFGKCPICGKNIFKGEFKDKSTNKKRYNYYCEGYTEGCSFKLYDETKYFKSVLKINDKKIKSLLKNEPTSFDTLIGKDGIEFEGNLRLKINEKDGKKYVNFEYVKNFKK